MLIIFLSLFFKKKKHKPLLAVATAVLSIRSLKIQFWFELTSGQIIFVTYKYNPQFNTLIITLVPLPQTIAYQALENQLLCCLLRITVDEVAMLTTCSNTHCSSIKMD